MLDSIKIISCKILCYPFSSNFKLILDVLIAFSAFLLASDLLAEGPGRGVAPRLGTYTIIGTSLFRRFFDEIRLLAKISVQIKAYGGFLNDFFY